MTSVYKNEIGLYYDRPDRILLDQKKLRLDDIRRQMRSDETEIDKII